MQPTIGQLFALYHDAERGPLASFTPQWRATHVRVRRLWEAHLGTERAWSTVGKADIRSYVRRRLEQVGIRQCEIEVKVLATIVRWAQVEEDLRVRNYARLFLSTREWRQLRLAHRPNRARFTRKEIDALRAVAWDVDPRLGLMVDLCDELGRRYGHLTRLRRSDVGRAWTPEPTSTDAPYGWIVVTAALEKGGEQLVFLTASARQCLECALCGHLARFEERWVQKGEDYPLFPAKISRRGPRAKGSRMDRRTLNKLLRRAERRARIEHVHGRSFHGIRRRVADEASSAGASEGVLKATGGWRSWVVPRTIYLERQALQDLARARELREARAAS